MSDSMSLSQDTGDRAGWKGGEAKEEQQGRSLWEDAQINS